MKKLISIIITVVLALTLTATAFADYGNGWDIYGEYDYAAAYTFDDAALKNIRNTAAEALEKAYGYSALYTLVTKLQENGIFITDYKVLKQKTANYVFNISVIDSWTGNTWEGIFSVYTHQGSQYVVDTLSANKKVPFLAIFLTEYHENMKINDYDEHEQITGEETLIADAIDQFIDFIRHYAERYEFYYGDDYWYDDGNG